jgi:hypothetical protein
MQEGLVAQVGSAQPTFALQFVSTVPVQVSVAGVTAPTQLPQVANSPADWQVCVPGLHVPTFSLLASMSFG